MISLKGLEDIKTLEENFISVLKNWELSSAKVANERGEEEPAAEKISRMQMQSKDYKDKVNDTPRHTEGEITPTIHNQPATREAELQIQ